MSAQDSGQAGALTDTQFEALRGRFPKLTREGLDGLVGIFQKRREKWQQKPFVDGFPRFQDYVESQVRLSVQMQRCGPFSEEFCVSYEFIIRGLEDRASPSATEFPDVSLFQGGHKHVVLVPVVDLPAEPKHFIAVPVGFHRVPEQSFRPLEGLLYRSLIKGSFHIVPCIPARQGFDSPVFWRSLNGAPKAHPAAVEGGAEIEDRVTRHKSHPRGNGRIVDIKAPRLIVRTLPGALAIALEEPLDVGVELVDYLLGPSDLDHGIAE